MKEIISTFIFFGYLIFCAIAPNRVSDWFDFVQVIFIQVIVACAIAYHWYMRIDFSKLHSGSTLKAYRAIDAEQFEFTNYLNLEFKTKLPFATGILKNEPAPKIISERYGLELLIMACLGEFLIFMTNVESFKIRHGVLGLLFKVSMPLGKNILGLIGGYIFLWSFSLFLLSVLSKDIYTQHKTTVSK